MAGFDIWSEITSDATEASGARHSAWSGWDKNTAPADHVINNNTVRVEWHGQNGSENSYDLVYEDSIEIVPIPGLKLPSTVKVRTYARSPKGHTSGRGWSKIKVVGDYVKCR